MVELFIQRQCYWWCYFFVEEETIDDKYGVAVVFQDDEEEVSWCWGIYKYIYTVKAENLMGEIFEQYAYLTSSNLTVILLFTEACTNYTCIAFSVYIGREFQ